MEKQRTDEWMAKRLGKINASAIHNLMKKTKYGESKYKENMRIELAIERLTGKQANPIPMNEHMRRGIEREPEARDAFVSATKLNVREVGSIQHPNIINSGASPDGIVEVDKEEFCLEIKCPAMPTHARNILADIVPSQYKHQIQWQIACTNSAGAYWVSYNPDFTDDTKIKYLFVERDDKLIKEMEDEVIKFDKEVDVLVNLLKEGVKNG